METKKEDDEFFDLEKKYNEIDDAAIEEKRQNTIIDLVDEVLDENNPFNDTMETETEDIYFDDNLFDGIDKKDTKILRKKFNNS